MQYHASNSTQRPPNNTTTAPANPACINCSADSASGIAVSHPIIVVITEPLDSSDFLYYFQPTGTVVRRNKRGVVWWFYVSFSR